jgi:hypothetical protein
MKSRLAWVIPILILCLFAFGPSTVRASDHADPLHLTDPYSNITGLFSRRAISTSWSSTSGSHWSAPSPIR